MPMVPPWLLAFAGYTRCLPDSTLDYFSFVFDAVTPFPLNKELIELSCTFTCISHALTVDVVYFLPPLSGTNRLLIVQLVPRRYDPQ
jgi:hypothetical protein